MSKVESHIHHYRAEIDGLRAIAVMPVILFHAGFSLFSGGFVGVDIFFVISGYLISSIIIREKNSEKFSIAAFYERRARRILPALYFMILVTIPFAWLWLMPVQLKNFSLSIVSVLAFCSNFLFWKTTGYFDAASDELPLLHTWSLGVEEQFYFILPLALLLFWKSGPKKLMLLVAGGIAISLALSEWGWRETPMSNFFLPFSRAWELLAGTLLALARYDKPSLPDRNSNFLSVAGIALILFSIFFYNEKTPFPSVYALAPVLGTVLVLCYAVKGTLVAKLLSSKIMVGIGLISYSAYLWHQPLFAFARVFHQNPLSKTVYSVLILITIVLAWFTWRFIETPFRNPKHIPARKYIPGIILVSVALIALGLQGYKKKGYPKRISVSNQVEYDRLMRAVDSSKTRFKDGCKYSVENIDSDFEKAFQSCIKSKGKAVLIIGDSHGTDLYNSLAALSGDKHVVGITKPGCRPSGTLPTCHYQNAVNFVKRFSEKISVVIFTQKGSYFLKDYKYLPVQEESVNETISYLSVLAKLTKVIWMGPQAEPGIDLRNLNILVSKHHQFNRESENHDIKSLDTFLQRKCEFSKVDYISKLDLQRFNFEEDYISDDEFTYSDKDHWSTFGETYYGKRLMKNPALSSYLSK